MKRVEKPITSKQEAPISFNLKNIFDKVEEEITVEETTKDLPSDAFTKEDVLKIWEQFLGNLKAQNKIPAYNALHTAKISLKETSCICFEFSSLSLSSEFDLQKDALMLKMREGLNNHSIEFEVKIHSEPTKNFIKSKNEIFQEMAEKKPILLKMKNEFGLDFNPND